MERFFRCALTFLLLLAAGMECCQVAARYFLQMPVIWLDETILFPAIWIYMLGFANASREDSQITVRILPALLPCPRFVAFADLLARFFTLIISLWLAWHSAQYFFYSLQANRKTAYYFLPLSIGETAIAIALLLACCFAFNHFVKSCKNLLLAFRAAK